MNENCNCEEEYALYNDMGVIRCQCCMGKVSTERAEAFRKYNQPTAAEEIRCNQSSGAQ